MSRVVRKSAFCICENKDADQLRGNSEADQRLCFRYSDSTIPLLPKSEISSLQPSSVAVQTGLCQTWSETPKTDKTYFCRRQLTTFKELIWAARYKWKRPLNESIVSQLVMWPGPFDKLLQTNFLRLFIFASLSWCILSHQIIFTNYRSGVCINNAWLSFTDSFAAN